MSWIASAVSEVPAETPESARANDVALVSGQTNGAKAANLFSGFTDPGLTISTQGVTKFANRTDFAFGVSDGVILQSTYSCMDSEITASTVNNILYLRVANGRGIYLTNTGGATRCGWVVSGLNLASTAQPTNVQDRAAVDQTTLPNWTGGLATDTWTLGAVGFDVYVKYNGVECMRFKEYAVMQAGVAAVWGGQYSGGTSNVTLTYLPASGLRSNRLKRTIDIRDFGASQFRTTGSISASSNQLTVADASGFAVGNTLIVETSSEAGLGLPGTMGVGGAWPALSYATTAVMNADTTQGSETYCWDRSSGLIYYFNGSAWVANVTGTDPQGNTSHNNGDFYAWKASPKALVATITGKAGNVLTLDKTASASVSGANVFFDNYSALFPFWFDGGGYGSRLPTNFTVRIPNGDWALGAPVYTRNTDPIIGYTLRGASKAARIFAPRGAPNIRLNVLNGAYCQISNLTIEGNHKPDPANNDYPKYFSIPLPLNGGDYFTPEWVNSCGFERSNDCIAKNIDVIDVLAGALCIKFSDRIQVTDINLTMNARIAAYTQWYITAVNGSDCTFTNCKVLYSRGLIKGLETFVGVNHRYINCGGYNVLCSTNNSYNWLYDGFYSDIYADSFSYINSGFWGEAIVNINNNSYHSASDGGWMKNPRIVQHGYITSNNDTLPFLQIAPDVYNVRVTGQYDSDTTPFVAGKGGYFEAPDYGVIDPAKSVRGIGPSAGRGVIIEAPGTVVTGLRVVGATKSGQYNVLAAGSATGSTITGNIADVFTFTGSVTKSGNRTNAGVAVP